MLRIRPFDVATAGGRSSERYRRVLLSALSTGIARGTTLLTLAIAVPLLLSHLGQERYGLWATLSSVMTLLSFADLGLGSGLMNVIASADAEKDAARASMSVSSVFFLLSVVAITLSIGFALEYSHVSWAQLFNVSSVIAAHEAGPATAVFVLCFLLSMPLGIVQRIHAGYQESFLGSLWQALGSVLGLGGVLLTVRLDAGLPWVVFALAGSPLLAYAANTIWLFRSHRPWLSPRLSGINLRTTNELLRTGLLFFVLQLCAAVSYQSATLIIARVMGARYVPQYSVPMTLFQLSPWLVSLLMTPLWPAYAESRASGDVAWIEKSFRRSIRLALCLNVPSAILLMAFGAQIVRVWAGPVVQPERVLLLSMGAWTILNSFNGPLAMLFNGLTVIRFQVVCASLMTVCNVILGVLLTGKIGVVGVVIAMVAAQTLFILVPSAVYVPKLLARMQAQKAIAL